MLKRDFFTGQDDKQGVHHSDWPHAKQHSEPKATNGKALDLQVEPKGLLQSHLSENAQRGHEQGNDDPKDVTAGIRGARGPLS